MKTLLALILTLALAAALAACGDDDDSSTVTPTATDSGAAETPTPAATVVDVCGENPDPATDEDLVVESPAAGDELSSPATVSGSAPTFDGRVWFHAYDGNGNDIIDIGGSTNFGHLDEPFEQEIEFSVATDTPACLEVYLLRPEEGGITDVVQIPVILLAPDDATPVETSSPGEVTDVPG